MTTTKLPTIKDETFRQELDSLYRENFQRMYEAAKSVAGNRHDAEDAVQNVFVRLVQGQPSSNFRKNPKAYLCKAAINQARNMIRSRGRQKLVDEDFSELNIPAESGGANEDFPQMLMAALPELDPHLVEMLCLRFHQGYRCKDIAEELGRTSIGVAVNLHRAVRKLRKLMSNPGGTQ